MVIEGLVVGLYVEYLFNKLFLNLRLVRLFETYSQWQLPMKLKCFLALRANILAATFPASMSDPVPRPVATTCMDEARAEIVKQLTDAFAGYSAN